MVRIKLRILITVPRIRSFENSTTRLQVCYICIPNRTGLSNIGSSVLSLFTYCFKLKKKKHNKKILSPSDGPK